MSAFIGIILDEHQGDPEGISFSRLPFYALRKDYFSAVAAAGGTPIGVAYDQTSFERLLDICDGWIIPGGDHRFDKSWYELPPPDEMLKPSKRADFEDMACRTFLEQDIPFLGVCNGMQVLGAVTGGKLSYVPPSEDQSVLHAGLKGGFAPDHDVKVTVDTKIHALAGVERFKVNSAHRERVTSVGSDIVVSAAADDGVIEAIELSDHPYAVGIQWHPEIKPDSFGQRLFQDFVETAKAHK